MTAEENLAFLKEGNRKYFTASATSGDYSPARRHETAERGQQPRAIVVSCSDSRVVPEAIFSCSLGELFTVRIAGNVLNPYQLGSVRFAVSQFNCPLVIIMGHTRCDTITASLTGRQDSFLRAITDEIRKASGAEKDPEKICRLNVRRGVQLLRETFRMHPEFGSPKVCGAIYDVDTGEVRWI